MSFAAILCLREALACLREAAMQEKGGSDPGAGGDSDDGRTHGVDPVQQDGVNEEGALAVMDQPCDHAVGENTWIVAGWMNKSVEEIQELNPGVDLAYVKPGQSIVVEGEVGRKRKKDISQARLHVSARK
eukprot:gene24642-29974_t